MSKEARSSKRYFVKLKKKSILFNLVNVKLICALSNELAALVEPLFMI